MNRSTTWRRMSLLVACSGWLLLVTAGPALAQLPSAPTEPGGPIALGDGVSFDSALSTGVPPDDDRVTATDQAQAAPTFSYYHVAGTTLKPRSSTTDFAYDGSGCAHVTAGAGTGLIMNTELHLPEGAVIKYLRVYYNDTNAASGVAGFLTRYAPGTAAADLVSAASTAAFAGGFGFVVSSELTEIVNTTSYAYTLIGWPGAASVANQICGLRIAYYAPATAPGTPTLNPPTVAGNTVGLSWTTSGGTQPTSFLLTATTPGGVVLVTVPLTGSSVSFGGVPSGTYHLSLVAVNEVGSSPPSATVVLVVP